VSFRNAGTSASIRSHAATIAAFVSVADTGQQ